MKSKIIKWMRNNYVGFFDDATGEFQCTQIAEACADALGHNEWLEDSQHPVWDCVVEVGEWAERQAVK
jgi:hypothetical protein